MLMLVVKIIPHRRDMMLLKITEARKCQIALLRAKNMATMAKAERTGIELGEGTGKGARSCGQVWGLSQRQHEAIQSGSC